MLHRQQQATHRATGGYVGTDYGGDFSLRSAYTHDRLRLTPTQHAQLVARLSAFIGSLTPGTLDQMEERLVRQIMRIKREEHVQEGAAAVAAGRVGQSTHQQSQREHHVRDAVDRSFPVMCLVALREWRERRLHGNNDDSGGAATSAAAAAAGTAFGGGAAAAPRTHQHLGPSEQEGVHLFRQEPITSTMLSDTTVPVPEVSVQRTPRKTAPYPHPAAPAPLQTQLQRVEFEGDEDDTSPSIDQGDEYDLYLKFGARGRNGGGAYSSSGSHTSEASAASQREIMMGSAASHSRPHRRQHRYGGYQYSNDNDQEYGAPPPPPQQRRDTSRNGHNMHELYTATHQSSRRPSSTASSTAGSSTTGSARRSAKQLQHGAVVRGSKKRPTTARAHSRYRGSVASGSPDRINGGGSSHDSSRNVVPSSTAARGMSTLALNNSKRTCDLCFRAMAAVHCRDCRMKLCTAKSSGHLHSDCDADLHDTTGRRGHIRVPVAVTRKRRFMHMVPCYLCGRMLTPKSLRFHYKSCAVKRRLAFRALVSCGGLQHAAIAMPEPPSLPLPGPDSDKRAYKRFSEEAMRIFRAHMAVCPHVGCGRRFEPDHLLTHMRGCDFRDRHGREPFVVGDNTGGLRSWAAMKNRNGRLGGSCLPVSRVIQHGGEATF